VKVMMLRMLLKLLRILVKWTCQIGGLRGVRDPKLLKFAPSVGLGGGLVGRSKINLLKMSDLCATSCAFFPTAFQKFRSDLLKFKL